MKLEKIKLAFESDYEVLKELCPPPEYAPIHLENVYRWVFATIEDSRNFQTQYHKNPKRFQNASDARKCEGLALSMFDDLEKAKKRFKMLADTIGAGVYATLGTNIAKGFITEKCGLNSNTDEFGHFNHHPAEDLPAQKSFVILEDEKL